LNNDERVKKRYRKDKFDKFKIFLESKQKSSLLIRDELEKDQREKLIKSGKIDWYDSKDPNILHKAEKIAKISQEKINKKVEDGIDKSLSSAVDEKVEETKKELKSEEKKDKPKKKKEEKSKKKESNIPKPDITGFFNRVSSILNTIKENTKTTADNVEEQTELSEEAKETARKEKLKKESQLRI